MLCSQTLQKQHPRKYKLGREGAGTPDLFTCFPPHRPFSDLYDTGSKERLSSATKAREFLYKG